MTSILQVYVATYRNAEWLLIIVLHETLQKRITLVCL